MQKNDWILHHSTVFFLIMQCSSLLTSFSPVSPAATVGQRCHHCKSRTQPTISTVSVGFEVCCFCLLSIGLLSMMEQGTAGVFLICAPSLSSTSNFPTSPEQMMVMLDSTEQTSHILEEGAEIPEHPGNGCLFLWYRRVSSLSNMFTNFGHLSLSMQEKHLSAALPLQKGIFMNVIRHRR